jgi:uncharacterized protein
MLEVVTLSGFAFLAGLLDSVVGGGGLIQIPALLIVLPNAPIATLFGTNKLSSIAGTSVAVWQYSRTIAIPWNMVLPGAIAAGIFAFWGANTVQWLQPSLLRPIILVLLTAVGIYTALRKEFGTVHQPKRSPTYQLGIGVGISAIVGFYDGFFGPGTGSFLIFGFISLLGFSFLRASAAAKVINWATNFTALLAFASSGHVFYQFAVPMAVCNILGAIVGTRLAMLKGNQFIRLLFLGVVAALILKLAYDLWHG